MLALKCISCGSAVEPATDSYSCSSCGAHWPVVAGIPRLFQAESYYWGEVGRDEARALLQAARAGSWAESVRNHFGDDEMVISILDLQRAAWLPLLGLGSDAVALDIGSGYGAITHSLAMSVDEVYSVEAIPERIEFIQTRLQQEGIENVHLIQASATALPFFEKTFDLVVVNGILEWVGEWDLECDPRTAQLKALSTVQRLLKDDGVLVVGIENRFGYSLFLGGLDHSGISFTSLLPRRWATFYLRHKSFQHHRTALNPKKEYRTYTYSAEGYRKLLGEAGFPAVSLYWAEPGYNQPYRLIPLSARRLIQDHFLNQLDFPRPPKLTAWRRQIKRAVAKLGMLPWVLPEFVIIASKDPRRRTRVHEWFAEQLTKALTEDAGSPIQPEKIGLTASTGPFHFKDVLRFWEPQAAYKGAIGKATVRISEGGEALQAEYANLKLICERLEAVPGLSVRVPKPIGSLRTANAFYFIESAAKGVQFSRVIRRRGYFRSPLNVRRDFARVLLAGTQLASVLRSLPAVGLIDARWYEVPDALRHSAEMCSQIETLRSFKDASAAFSQAWIQHNDFTMDNVFLDEQTGQVEVVDWGDLAGGLPPLYDLFSLVVSVSYLDPSHGKVSSPEEKGTPPASFLDLLFSDAGIIAMLEELILEACERLHVALDSLPALFLEFLIVRTNSYQLRSTADARIHEALLRRFVANQGRLVAA